MEKKGKARKTDEKKKNPNSRKKKKKAGKRRKVLRFLRNCALCIAIFLIIISWALFAIRAAGRQQLARDSVGSVEEMRMDEYVSSKERQEERQGKNAGEIQEAIAAAEAEQEEKEGRIYYNEKAYDFNRDIMTFLVMGIDQRFETVQEQTEGFEGGSADTIFLVVLNPHSKKMQIIAIDRNTMTDVDIYDYYGEYKETIRTQICVQHGFGDGTVKSAQYMEKAVSNLLYGLPLNGYCAINMSAIERINDAVGGVDVVVLEDLTKWNSAMVKGASIHLSGKDAVRYVRSRDRDMFGSAEGRLERQKQYISAFIAKAKEEFKKNPGLPVTLFQELQPYMTTDLNLEKTTYLASMAAGLDFSGTDMYKIPGKTVMGDMYEEFYVDEDAMYEMILNIFYEEVMQ